MKKMLLLLLVSAITVPLFPAPAAFDDLAPPAASRATNVSPAKPAVQQPGKGLWHGFVSLSRTLQAELSGLLIKVDKKFSLLHFLLILLLSLAYGVVHAAGPGHGKLLLTSWILRNNSNRRDAALMAAVTSAVHTGAALVLALFFQLILSVVPDGNLQMTLRKVFSFASGLLVIAVGLYHLLHHRKSSNETGDSVLQRRSSTAVAVAAGIVPCPLAMTIMFLAFANRVFYLGVISVLGMSAGMFLLLFLMGWVVAGSRKGFMERLLKQETHRNLAQKLLEYLSAGLIMLLGLFLAVSQL